MGLWIRRVLAIVAAIALVVGAINIRRSWDDGDDPAAPDDTSTSPESGDSNVIACLDDLAEWCRQLDLDGGTLRIEPWADTVASFTGADAPAAWVTFSPLADLATGYTAETPVASTELVVAARSDRSQALVATCGTDSLWTCIGEQAGAGWTDLGGEASWGKVLPGLSDPTTDAVGLLTLGAAATSFFGRTDYGSTEIDSDTDFFGWFVPLVRAIPDDALDDPLALLLRRPSAVGIVGTTEQHHAQLAGSRASDFPATYPGPMARADVVVTVRDGADVPRIGEPLAATLLAAGWDAPSADPDGLPSGRALVRLQGLWKETRS